LEFNSIDLINLTYDMVFIIDKKGNIKFANTSAEQNLFYSKKEFLSMNLNEILFESDKFLEILDTIILSADDSEKNKDRFSASDIDLIKIKEAIGYQDLILISKDTNLKIMMANFQARRIIHGDEELFLLILRDITDRNFLSRSCLRLQKILKSLFKRKQLNFRRKMKCLKSLRQEIL
jgi:PAS domain-containing protein